MNKGEIIICDVCGKVDIDPDVHICTSNRDEDNGWDGDNDD